MNLLLIHGIAQGGRNPKDLERTWLEALNKGLKKSKLTMPGNVNRTNQGVIGEREASCDSRSWH